ncbi:unnamed protein product [Allacma fusca]|uniref:Uncharacterized protein n=1 Tax=Allacma fusca TaxID=39272 RepID=A0A8J2JSJ6_9HEXA|nr:unnamed protein product [Allacma fusca]
MAYSQKRDLYQSAFSMDEEDFPLLEPYNPAKKDLSNQKPFDFFRSWQFFEQADSFWISSKVLGRRDVCPATSSTHIYLGRQIQSGKPTIVSWPLSQAREVSKFVRTFLHDLKSRTFRYVTFGVSALRGKEPRTYNWAGDRVRFWAKPDLDLGILRLAVTINNTTRKPELLFNNRVNPSATNRYPSWPGPVICLDMEALDKLIILIDQSLRIKQEPSSPTPPDTPPPTCSPMYNDM